MWKPISAVRSDTRVLGPRSWPVLDGRDHCQGSCAHSRYLQRQQLWAVKAAGNFSLRDKSCHKFKFDNLNKASLQVGTNFTLIKVLIKQVYTSLWRSCFGNWEHWPINGYWKVFILIRLLILINCNYKSAKHENSPSGKTLVRKIGIIE